jgi:glycosyltransferase involved in cell wall biosynthesis
MKICFVSEAKTIHTQRWLRGIAASGHDVHLISSSYAEIEGVQLHQNQLYHTNPIKTLSNCRKARKIVKQIQPDITHLFGLYSLSSLALLPAVFAVPNFVVTPWGTDVVYDFKQKEPFKSRLFKKYFLNQAKCITSLSSFMTGHIRKYISNGRTVEYVPWGADTEIFHPRYLNNNKDQFVIGITKAFTKKYGHVHLLEALSTLIHDYLQKNIKLVIVGKGELEHELKDLCRALKIDEFVVFEKFTSDKKQLRKYISTFDVYVMPSVYRSETLGVAAIEASAMGVPVIASEIGGIPEVVKNDVTGFLTEPGNSQDIVNALLLFLRNKELGSQMGRAARLRAEKLFSFSSSVSKMINCYEKVLGNQE